MIFMVSTTFVNDFQRFPKILWDFTKISQRFYNDFQRFYKDFQRFYNDFQYLTMTFKDFQKVY